MPRVPPVKTRGVKRSPIQGELVIQYSGDRAKEIKSTPRRNQREQQKEEIRKTVEDLKVLGIVTQGLYPSRYEFEWKFGMAFVWWRLQEGSFDYMQLRYLVRSVAEHMEEALHSLDIASIAWQEDSRRIPMRLLPLNPPTEADDDGASSSREYYDPTGTRYQGPNSPDGRSRAMNLEYPNSPRWSPTPEADTPKRSPPPVEDEQEANALLPDIVDLTDLWDEHSGIDEHPARKRHLDTQARGDDESPRRSTTGSTVVSARHKPYPVNKQTGESEAMQRDDHSNEQKTLQDRLNEERLRRATLEESVKTEKRLNSELTTRVLVLERTLKAAQNTQRTLQDQLVEAQSNAIQLEAILEKCIADLSTVQRALSSDERTQRT